MLIYMPTAIVLSGAVFCSWWNHHGRDWVEDSAPHLICTLGKLMAWLFRQHLVTFTETVETRASVPIVSSSMYKQTNARCCRG